MNTPLRPVSCFAALALFAASASAQTMKPGLWEVTNKLGGSPEMDRSMSEMQQQMASMPPAQRKMMEDMMAKQGVQMAGTAGGGMVTKMCVTKEMAERNQIPVQQQGDCTSSTSNKTSTGMKIRLTCTSPPSSGEGEFTFFGDSAYTMKMKLNSASQGTPKTTSIDASGKWLASDCGAIKPLPAPRQ